MSDVTIRAADGVELNAHRWPITGTAKANVLIIHGYAHHGGSFAEVAARFNKAGYGVYALDQRGHGMTPGRPGYIARFDDWVNDANAFIAQITAEHAGVPFVLMGHSLGCLALGLCVVRNKVPAKGLIFSSGLLKIPDHVPVFLQKLAGILGTLTPTLPVQKVDINATSRDPKAVKELNDDPLRYPGMMQARSGAEVAKAIADFQARMQEISLPLLILHGTKDKLTDCDGSRMLNERVASKDKALCIFEGGYHELYNDLDKDRWYSQVISWLDAHTLRPPV